MWNMNWQESLNIEIDTDIAWHKVRHHFSCRKDIDGSMYLLRERVKELVVIQQR